MKKMIISWLLALGLWINSVWAINLNSLWETTTTNTNTTTTVPFETWTWNASTTTTTTSWTNKTASKVLIIPEFTSLPADGKKVVNVIVQVLSYNEDVLTWDDVEVTAEIVWNDTSNSLWLFQTWAYSVENKYFQFTYTAWTKAWDVQLKVVAKSKSNPANEISQVEKLVLLASTNNNISTTQWTDLNNISVTSLDNATTESQNVNPNNVLSQNTTSSWTNTESVNVWNIHITKTEVLDVNRIKISFNKEIALSEVPVDMVNIESVKDKSKLEVSNVTLWEDKKSLIVFSKDPLKKEEYHVIVNTVVDWETMKAVSVVNGTTTVSWMWELILLLLAFLTSIWFFAYKRKQKSL